MEEDELIAESIEEEESGGLESMSIDELQEQLNLAIENEDYELASTIRDEINRRSSN